MKVVDYLILAIVILAIISAWRYTRKHGSCGSCSGCKKQCSKRKK